MPTTSIARRAEQVVTRCRELARFSEDAGCLRRTFLSPPMRDVHRVIASWVEPLGVKVCIDAVGNFRALYPGNASGAPRLLIGSHLDTVPNAGSYDGILGVVIAAALLEELRSEELAFAIEVIGFSEEEGVRFGTPFLGSRALIGTLNDQVLQTKDCNGIDVRSAIKKFGLNPEEIPAAGPPDNALAFLEFHIEQGPVLETLSKPLGVVEAIAGQSRLQVTFLGRTNHAGTTPMQLRSDALAGAAEWVSLVERVATTTPGAVATVGSISARPGVVNVIAGEVQASLDVRHREDAVRIRVVDDLIAQAEQIAGRRSLSVRHVTRLDQAAVPMDSLLIEEIEKAIRSTGAEPHRMVSGAGHDAMIVADKIPAGMIFLRTPGGISHDPAESVLPEDVAKAIECGVHLLRQLAAPDKFHARMRREQS